MRQSILLSVCLGICVVVAPSAQAAKVKVWQHHAAAHYDKAQLKHAVVSSEGAVRLSRQVRPLPGIEAAHVWDVAEDGDGNLFVATGDDGKIFKVTPNGAVTVAFTSEDSQVLCLAAAPDGSIYAGTGPGGHVVRIAPDGTAKVIADLADAYIWSLATDAKGQTIYAGTGPKGRVYRLAPDGKASVFYSTRQEHVHRVAVAADGTLYAGTDKSGLVYRIDPRGKGFVVFSAPQAEVRCLVPGPDGSIYAGTSIPTKRVPGGGSTSPGSSTITQANGGLLTLVGRREVASAEQTSTTSSSSSESKDSTTSKGSPAAAPSLPGSGENSLYRIAADGTVREVFREKAMILSLLRRDGRLLVGTGMNGQLFEIDEFTRERAEIARLDHGQVLCLHGRADGSVVLGTGDSGRLYVLQDRYAPRATVVCEVLDAKILSKWGALSWRANVPAGTGLTVALRSGNVAEPDDTWSDWSPEQADPQRAVVSVPTARFLQYRVTLTSDDAAATPSLHGITLRYATTNHPPEVTKLEVPDLDAVNLDDPKKLKFKWTATDANEDELTYSLFVRKDGWKNWVLLDDSLTKSEYEWDTTTTPSGTYELKIAASDRKDNAAEDALAGERVSAPFVVSHSPPTVTLKVVGLDGDQASIEATAVHPLARLTAASFAVNGKKWVNVFPTDGLFDARSEAFRFKSESLKPGTYVLVLKVRDAAGNTGTADVVFSVEAK